MKIQIFLFCCQEKMRLLITNPTQRVTNFLLLFPINVETRAKQKKSFLQVRELFTYTKNHSFHGFVRTLSIEAYREYWRVFYETTFELVRGPNDIRFPLIYRFERVCMRVYMYMYTHIVPTHDRRTILSLRSLSFHGQARPPRTRRWKPARGRQ